MNLIGSNIQVLVQPSTTMLEIQVIISVPLYPEVAVSKMMTMLILNFLLSGAPTLMEEEAMYELSHGLPKPMHLNHTVIVGVFFPKMLAGHLLCLEVTLSLLGVLARVQIGMVLSVFLQSPIKIRFRN